MSEAHNKAYIEAVRSRTFPGDKESYSISDEEWRRFLELEGLGLQEMTIRTTPGRLIAS